MTFWLFIVAAIMAFWGIYGYRKGFWPMLISFGILLFALLLVRNAGQTLVRYMNAMFMGAMLVLKSGLTDMSQGNLESAKEKLASIPKPFSDEGEKWAYLIVIGVAVAVCILVGLLFKKTPSVWGLILGLLYGYLLGMALLPILLGAPKAEVPLLPTGEGTGGPCAGLIGRFTCYLNEPGHAELCGTLIVVGTSLFVITVIVVTLRSSKGKKPPSGGESANK